MPTTYADSSDETLVAQTKAGDTRAFDELVVRHSRKLHAALYQMLGNYDDAYDVAQEAFAKAYRGIKHFNGDSAFYTWLYTITLNLTRNFVKKRNKISVFSINDDEFSDHSDTNAALADGSFTADTERQILNAELSEKLMAAINQLKPIYREAVMMHDVRGVSFAEMSQILGVSEGTIRSRLHYAHNLLQTLLADYLNQGEI